MPEDAAEVASRLKSLAACCQVHTRVAPTPAERKARRADLLKMFWSRHLMAPLSNLSCKHCTRQIVSSFLPYPLQDFGLRPFELGEVS